jgi:primase-polymerase (primpol)-like protein
VWKWATSDKGKSTKVPYRPDAPSKTASSTDPSTWSSYETAVNAVEFGDADGIGFCLFRSEFAAFDIDDCRNRETGEIDPWARALVDRAASYA